jgi:hypothetical protein
MIYYFDISGILETWKFPTVKLTRIGIVPGWRVGNQPAPSIPTTLRRRNNKLRFLMVG